MKTAKLFTTLLALMGLSVGLNAQVIIVQKADGSNPRMFHSIDTAVMKAESNDYLFFSGGEHSIQGRWRGYDNSQNKTNWLVVDKPLHFVGSGYMGADATTIGGSAVAFRKSASGSSITGLAFGTNNDLYLDSVSNMSISRCSFSRSIYLCGVGANDLITECRFSSIYGQNNLLTGSSSTYSCIISKCIFSDANSFSGLTLKNNIITYSSAFGSSLSYLTVENNIFFSSAIASSVINSTFRNNISYANNLCAGATNSCEGNTYAAELGITNVGDIFVKYSSSSSSNANDYHLKPAYQSFLGTDGTQVGIYGTTSPFKEGGATAYPQFLRKNVASETDGEGKLRVDVEVKAQTN